MKEKGRRERERGRKKEKRKGKFFDFKEMRFLVLRNLEGILFGEFILFLVVSRVFREGY